jgi:FlaG/FlaF family flagellin (archaellin)
MRRHVRAFRSLPVIVGVAVWVSSGAAPAQAADSIIGTWTLNVAKSTYSPGPPPKNLTVKFEAAGEGIKVRSDSVAADGSSTHNEYTANYDGKDYPLKGAADADSVSLKRIDANTTERTDKKAGSVVRTFTRKVSADGKTMTVTIKGTDDQGRPIENTVVLDRQ